MTAEPRDVEEIRADMPLRPEDIADRLAAADRENAELRAAIAATATDVERYVADRLADARQENAELRGEVDRLRSLAGPIREGYEASEAMRRDARAERDDLRAQLAAAQAQLAEAREDLRREQDALATLYGGFAAAAEARDHAEAQVLIQNGYTNRAATAAGVEQQRAEAAEARLEAVRAIATKAYATPRINDPFCVGMDIADDLRAALSAAPQPDSEPLPAMVKCIYTGSRWHPPGVCCAADSEPPASDEPARCDHDWDTMQPATTCRHCGTEYHAVHWVNCPGPAASGTPGGGR